MKTTVQDRYSNKGVNPTLYAQFLLITSLLLLYIRSCHSSTHYGKTLALRTDSNSSSDPMNGERSVKNERGEKQRQVKFSSSYRDFQDTGFLTMKNCRCDCIRHNSRASSYPRVKRETGRRADRITVTTILMQTTVACSVNFKFYLSLSLIIPANMSSHWFPKMMTTHLNWYQLVPASRWPSVHKDPRW